MPNRFELEQLRETTEKYTYHDPGTHGVWPRLVWERRRRLPAARLDDSEEFLGKRKALALQRWEDGFQKDRSAWLRKRSVVLDRTAFQSNRLVAQRQLTMHRTLD